MGLEPEFPATHRNQAPAPGTDSDTTHLGPATDPSRHGPFSAHVPLSAAGPAATSSRAGRPQLGLTDQCSISSHWPPSVNFALGERGRNSKQKEPWGQSQNTSSQCGRAGATWQAPGHSGPELGLGSWPCSEHREGTPFQVGRM